MISCPYDKSHQLLVPRKQGHLVKCKKNHPSTSKVICPFDATHVIEQIEYEHHIMTCETSGNVRNFKMSLEPQRKVGVVSIEEASEKQTLLSEEDWNGNHPSYNPEQVTETRNVSRILIGASKAERKRHRMTERERLSNLKENADSSRTASILNTTDSEKPLRKPRSIAKPRSSASSSADRIYREIDSITSQFQRVITAESNDSSDDSESVHSGKLSENGDPANFRNPASSNGEYTHVDSRVVRNENVVPGEKERLNDKERKRSDARELIDDEAKIMFEKRDRNVLQNENRPSGDESFKDQTRMPDCAGDPIEYPKFDFVNTRVLKDHSNPVRPVVRPGIGRGLSIMRGDLRKPRK